MYSSLLAVGIVFGTPAAVLVGMIFIGFFIIVAIIYNVTFARILFVSALDHRLPTSLALVNRYHTPARAIFIQTIIVGIIAALTYFIGPLFYPQRDLYEHHGSLRATHCSGEAPCRGRHC